MKLLSKYSIICLLVILCIASECDTPLVDRELAFFVKNESDETILIYTGEGQTSDFRRNLPDHRIIPYEPISPNRTGFISIPVAGPNPFDDELPDGLLRVWIFDEEVFNQVPYDSIRQNPGLFELITFTKDEYETMGDTLIIN